MKRTIMINMLCATLCAVPLSGCTGTRTPLTDGERMVLATLTFQAADGRALCSDRTTAGDPLINWRAMRVAPRSSRALVGWSAPRPLRSLDAIGVRRLIDDQIGGRRVVLREPTAPPRLPRELQETYESAAQRLTFVTDRQSVTIRDGWGGPSVVTRWWPLNRIAPSCKPPYRFSDPESQGNIGFVTVRSDHWGTIYALRKGKEGWTVTAQWTPWLY